MCGDTCAGVGVVRMPAWTLRAAWRVWWRGRCVRHGAGDGARAMMYVAGHVALRASVKKAAHRINSSVM